jgi:hypothetical protein
MSIVSSVRLPAAWSAEIQRLKPTFARDPCAVALAPAMSDAQALRFVVGLGMKAVFVDVQDALRWAEAEPPYDWLTTVRLEGMRAHLQKAQTTLAKARHPLRGAALLRTLISIGLVQPYR